MTTETKTVKLKTGVLIPNFRLPAANRLGPVGTWDYKQHWNLVLLFVRSIECRKCRHFLLEIAKHYDDYNRLEAEVLAISAADMDHSCGMARELALPFPVLSDSDGSVADLYLKETELSVEMADLEAAIFVADRWGAIFDVKIVREGKDLPDESEIRKWLEFIEVQCEECFPPEWPM